VAGLILVVEDEADMLNVLASRLRAAGYEVATAHDGEAAVDQVQKQVPDLILLDIMLPGLNGFQTLRRIKRIAGAERTRIIMMTGKSEPADRFWAESLGASAFVTKPFDMRKLIDQVGQLLAT
jgi:DNA-binding response OmpR family regulator